MKNSFAPISHKLYFAYVSEDSKKMKKVFRQKNILAKKFVTNFFGQNFVFRIFFLRIIKFRKVTQLSEINEKIIFRFLVFEIWSLKILN